MKLPGWAARPVVWATLAVFVDVGLARMGYGLVLPQIRHDLGGNYALYGFIGTAHFAGYLIGTVLGSLLVRRDPSARATATWSHLAVNILLFVSAFAPSPSMLAATRGLLGIACAVGIVSVVTGTLERVPAPERARASGLIWSGIALGLIVSSAGTQWVLDAPERWREATALCAVFALVAAMGLWISFGAPVSSFAPSAYSNECERPFNLGDLVAPDRYLLLALAYGCFGAAYTTYATFIVATLRGCMWRARPSRSSGQPSG